MLRHNVMRGALVAATLAGLTAFGSGAATAATAAATPCHLDGYVCMTTNDIYEPTVYVADGSDYTFLRPTEVTTLSNDTSKLYCVAAEYNFTLSPGQTITVTHTITSMGPTTAGCLS
ncbi:MULTISPECIES: hypothetical protein [unclassified Streptomyces]|uniref:hypothetical protein n=1 Tax=unclassified Streptomyces TaxID=2593676 RepID=UPI002E7FFF84|nr:hypothetical protein [Streptomyces sp. NBC_00523]WUD01547.1 hypothetical protein OHS17_18745 [Streptomyces sp. NBC_00523]